MKKLLFATLFMSLCLASCDIVELKGSGNESESGENWGVVSFALSGDMNPVSTRSTSQAEETAISNLQILVYNASNNLVAYAKANAGTLSAKVPLKVAGHTVYAVTNVSADLSGCSTPTDLNAQISYLKDNTLSGLQMIGKQEGLLFESGQTVNIEVRRFASKVEIDQITTAFTAVAYQKQAFTLTGIYLINVNGTCPYSQTATAGTWYNQMQYESGDCNALISEKFSSPVTIQTSTGQVTPHSTKHYFYCYANPTTTDKHRGDWSPRRTRLVVETKLGERVYYYPIDIVGAGNILDLNTIYKVTKLTITGPGTDHPDDPLDNGTVNFTVTVKNWASGFEKMVEY